jgi:signal transduction histidine kinase
MGWAIRPWGIKVRTSIRLKFSAFLAVLLLLTVLVLSLLVLRGIRVNQKAQYESYLAQQAQRANIYFIQTLLTEDNKVPQTFLETKGEEFAAELELITGQVLVLYDHEGKLVSRKIDHMESESIRETLAFALDDKTAYLTENDSIYYLTPLTIADEQVGVVQFHYSLSGETGFYNLIRQLFLTIGAAVFFLSFILGYLYFSSFANGIIRLEKMVGRVREGHYDTAVLKRRDEIGTLSEGIHEMSGRIQETIQDMKEEQKKLSLAVDKLSLLDQQQKQFIGNVTHEFKTPLTSIKAYLDLLEMYPDDGTLLETAKTNIESETRRLYEMVEKVLDLSAVEKYEYEYRKEKLEVTDVVQAVIDSLKGKMDKFGISLETDLKEAFVEADRDSLTIILVNLLDNAIKYNRTRGSIAVRNEVRDGQVVIEISDTGIGIPEEFIEKVYEPFFTVDRNRSRESGGAGLGLSLARKYAQIQSGSLTLVRTGPEGTTFRIQFPVYVEPGEENPLESPEPILS